MGLASSFYFGISGIEIYNPEGVVSTSGYAAVFNGMADGSKIADFETADYTNAGTLVSNSCCGASFYNLVSNAGHTGGVPLTIGSGTLQDYDLSFYSPSLDHPRAGDSNLVVGVSGMATGYTHIINFYGLYEEANKTDKTTPLNLIHARRGMNFFGGDITSGAPG